MTVLTAYANDSKDYWPYCLDSDLRYGATRSRRIDPPAPGHRGDYGLISGWWHVPVLDAYSYDPFAEPLICPADADALSAARDANEKALRMAIRDQPPVLRTQLSWAMYLAPAALEPNRLFWGPEAMRVAKHADVQFPSQKAALFDCAPFHDMTDDLNTGAWPMRPWRLVISAADGSAQYRSTTDINMAVLPFPPERPDIPNPVLAESEMWKLQLTPRGVHGRDW